MATKVKNVALRIVLPIVFWLGVWQILAVLVGNDYLLPDIPATASALVGLITEGSFYMAVGLTALRVLSGLTLGICLGVALAFLCSYSGIVRAIISPIITVIRSTPVASFIVVLWIILSGDALAIFIGFLMVMPIIYQNVLSALSSIDPQLSEVAEVFEFSRKRRLGLLILPKVKEYLIPAVISSVGLAWKAEIAAEIIAYTKRSIGQGINDAKFFLETPTVFAWTAVIIILSILLEKGTRLLIGRWKK